MCVCVCDVSHPRCALVCDLVVAPKQWYVLCRLTHWTDTLSKVGEFCPPLFAGTALVSADTDLSLYVHAYVV